MATWSVTVTNKGIALQTKQVNGATISFTRVVSGSGSVSIVNLKEQTAVKSIVQTLSMESLKVLDDTFKITVLLSNAEVTEGYNLSQIGFYATDPDEGEILFAIGQIDTPRAIPTNEDSPGYCLEFAFTFQNSNNATIEITPDMSAYVTMNVVNDIVENTKDEVSISGKGTGNLIAIDDSTDAPFNYITVYGGSRQITTTGKNILPVDENLTLSDVYGIDVNIPIGSYKVTLKSQTHNGDEYPYIRFTTNNVWIKLEDNLSKDVVLSSEETKIYIYTNGMNAAESKDVEATLKQLMVSIGGGEYEPYTGGKPAPNPDYPQEIESVGDSGSVIINTTGKNLFNCRDVVEGSLYNSAVIADDDFVTLECDNSEGTTTAYKNYWTHICKNLKKDTDYRIVVEVKTLVNCGLYAVSIKTPNTTESQFDENLVIQQVGTFSQVIHTNDADWTGTVYALRTFAQFSPGASGKCVFRISLQQTEDTSTNYEPYKETTATVPLTEPLYGIGTTKDEIGIQNDIKMNVGKVVLDGSDDEAWYFNALQTSGKYSYYIQIDNAKPVAKALSNAYVYKSWYDEPWNISQDIVSITGNSRLYLYTDYATLDELREALSNNPVTVIYELDKPVITPLTEEQRTALQNLLTFEPITNVFADDLATLDVEYFKNTENGKAMATLKQENNELRKLIGDVNTVLEGLIGGA